MTDRRVRVVRLNLSRGYGGIERTSEGYAAALDHARFEQNYVLTPFSDCDAHIDFMRSCEVNTISIEDLRPEEDAVPSPPSPGLEPRPAAAPACKNLLPERLDFLLYHARKTWSLRRRITDVLAHSLPPQDICHLHAGYYDWLAAGAWACRTVFPASRIVIHLHNSTVFFLPTLFEKRMFARADAGVFNSNFTRSAWESALGFSVRRACVLPNPVIMDDICSSARPSREPGRPFTFATFGRLSPIKGNDVAIQAFHLLRDDLPNTRLWIVGDGPDRARLAGLIESLGLSERVHLRDFERDRKTVFSEMDVLIQPTTTVEALGLSVIEGMAAGMAVVATAVGGLPETVKDGETGLLVPPGDVRALAAAMKTLTRDSSLRNRLGRNASLLAHDRYEASRAVKETERLYDALMAR
ncbi:MAG: glycosyltransferase family 4 protein [Phycisphaerae bacterium]|nr:glycosyltransferase family 4 protein [Phycisphaerae bacterium]